MSGNANQSVYDSILDGTLDDIADLPSFAAWPAGAYRAFLPNGFEQKEINDKPCFELKFVCKEVMELNNAADQEEAPKVNDECSIVFGMDSDTGKGFFKEAIKPFVAHLGMAMDQRGAIRAAVEASKGMEVLAIMKRTAKKDKDTGEVKLYAKLDKIEIL